MEWRRRLKRIESAVVAYLSTPEVKAAPPVLTLALRLRQWQSLPVAGGLLDQPESLMQQIDTALAAYNAWRTEN